MKGRGKWKERLPNGRIAIPFGFHKNFPSKDLFKKWLLHMNKDLGCVQLVHVPAEKLQTTHWTHGILVIHTNDLPNDNWCKSALGQRPGYTSDNGPIVLYGARAGWQLLLIVTGSKLQPRIL